MTHLSREVVTVQSSWLGSAPLQMSALYFLRHLVRMSSMVALRSLMACSVTSLLQILMAVSCLASTISSPSIMALREQKIHPLLLWVRECQKIIIENIVLKQHFNILFQSVGAWVMRPNCTQDGTWTTA